MPEQTGKVKLLKFGKKIDMKAFQEGILYMNTLEHFQKLECCELRGDKDEGLSAIYQAKGGTLSRQNDKGEFVQVGTIVDTVRYREKNSAYANVFCMYALQFCPQKQYIDDPSSMRKCNTWRNSLIAGTLGGHGKRIQAHQFRGER